MRIAAVGRDPGNQKVGLLFGASLVSADKDISLPIFWLTGVHNFWH